MNKKLIRQQSVVFNQVYTHYRIKPRRIASITTHALNRIHRLIRSTWLNNCGFRDNDKS